MPFEKVVRHSCSYRYPSYKAIKGKEIEGKPKLFNRAPVEKSCQNFSKPCYFFGA